MAIVSVMAKPNGRESAPLPGARPAWGRFARPAPGGLPRLWLFSDPLRLPDPRLAMAALPRGAGVVARGLAPGLLRPVARLARQRGLKLLVAGDGRAALALGAGLHLPDRRESGGLLPFLLARRARPGHLIMCIAAHGGQRGAARARRLGVDCLFLSPLFPTRSHPGAPALGPLRWAALARGLPAPCMALGGITPARLGAVPRRAAGVAAIGGLAPPVAHLPQ
jgi:thiamine-phosphate pyrophosphorylase